MAGISKVKIKRASGKVDTRYRITYRDSNGQHTSKLYDTKESAKKDLYKYDKVNSYSLNITIGQMSNTYMDSIKERHSYTTIKDTEAYMDNHISKLFEVKYEKFSSVELERFINNIAKEHTPNVANQALKKIKAVASYCYKNGLIRENKFKVVSNIPVENKPHYSLEENEIIEVLNNCKDLYPKYYALIYTGIATGTRIGELSALTIDDVHFAEGNNYIHIDKQYSKDILLPHTKTKDIRDVAIFDDLADVLRMHIENLPKGSKLLFPNKAGNYQNLSNLRNRVWYPLLVHSGITKRVRIHDLRSSYINLTLSSKLSIKFVQAQVGHKKSQTTLDIYARNNGDMKKIAMEVLNEKFSQRNK